MLSLNLSTEWGMQRYPTMLLKYREDSDSYADNLNGAAPFGTLGIEVYIGTIDY